MTTPRSGSGNFSLKYTKGAYGFTYLEVRLKTLDAAIREAFKIQSEKLGKPVEISGEGNFLSLNDMKVAWNELGLLDD